MRQYLVVAHRTLVGPRLLDAVRERVEAGPCRFHLVVPVWHPSGSWSEGQVEAAARERLDEGMAAFRELGAEVDGDIGDANPVYAITTALRELDGHVDEIVISTLPPRASQWLKLDVINRVRREVHLPLTHIVAEHEPAIR